VSVPSSELNAGYAFRLEQTVEGHHNRLLERTTKENAKSIQMEFSSYYVLKSTAVQKLGITEELSKLLSGSTNTRLVANISNSQDTAIAARDWKWDAESKSILETLVSTAIDQKSKELATQSIGRAMQWIEAEKSQLDRRLAALEESALARKEGWEHQVQLLFNSIVDAEKDSSLTARRQSIVR
jgi:hypothetical protein